MATTQNFNYPSSSDVTVTGIGNPVGQPYPTTAVPVAGENPSGNLTAIQTDANGNLITTPATGSVQHVIVDSSALPTGAATSGLQTSGNTTLTTISTTAASILLDLTNGTQITQITGTVPLPTGASTANLQVTGNTALTTIASNQTNGTQVTSVNNFPATQPVSGSVTVVQPTGTNLHTAVDSSALPTGAATSALQIALNAQVPTTLGQKTSAASMAVVLASDQSSVPTTIGGKSTANPPVFNTYSTTPITTATYVTLIASTASIINYVDIFDSSGQAMILAVGAIGSEVIQGYVGPGGDQIPLRVAAGSRISYKALTANATAGYLLMSVYT